MFPEQLSHSNRMLFELLQRLPKLPDTSVYYLEEQLPMLHEYTDTHIQYLKTDTLNPQKAALMRKKRELKNNFITTCSERVYGIDGEPAIFQYIDMDGVEQIKKFKREELLRVFPNTSPAAIAALSDSELNQKYARLTIIKKEVDELNNKLREQISQQKKQVFSTIDVTLEPSSNIDEPTYAVRVKGMLMGYTTHLILNSAYDLAGLRSFREALPYNGAMKFDLNAQEFSALSKYVTDVYERFQLIKLVFTYYLGEEASLDYLYKGVKLLSAEIKTSEDREAKDIYFFMSKRVRNQFKQYPKDDLVMIFDMVTIDLTSHPDRILLRKELENMYLAYGLQNGTREPKTFIRDIPGFEFVSLLGPQHMRSIFRDCITYAHMNHIARNRGYQSWASAECLITCGVETPAELYYQTLLAELMNLPCISSQIKANQIFPRLKKDATLKEVQDVYEKALNTLLNDSYQPTFAAPPQEQVVAEPTDAQKRLLLPEDNISTLYSDKPNVSRFELFPVTEHAICLLGRRLLDSEKVMENASQVFETYRSDLVAVGFRYPSLKDFLIRLTGLLVERLNKAKSNPDNLYYGKGQFKLTAQSWMTIVASICYHQEIGLSYEAINNCFKTLCELFADAEDSNKCTRGGGGRLGKAVEVLFKVNSSEPFLSADLELRRECADRVFLTHIANSPESAMAYNYKLDANKQIGLITIESIPEKMPEHLAKKFFTELAKQYNPATIYKACYQTYLDNFITYARDKDDMSVYSLLQSLGFVSHTGAEAQTQNNLTQTAFELLDQRFRLIENGVPTFWNLEQFKRALPEKLIEKMVTYGVLKPKIGGLVNELSIWSNPSNETTAVESMSMSYGERFHSIRSWH